MNNCSWKMQMVGNDCHERVFAYKLSAWRYMLVARLSAGDYSYSKYYVYTVLRKSFPKESVGEIVLSTSNTPYVNLTSYDDRFHVLSASSNLQRLEKRNILIHVVDVE